MGTAGILILCVFVAWSALGLWSGWYNARLDRHLESLTPHELVTEMKKKGMLK